MRKILLMGIVLLSLQQTFACDICGCSAGNYFIGPFPQFRKHFFGTRYTFRSFDSRLTSDPTQFSKDFYQTVELWSGWNIDKKWQLIAFVPYSINRQTSDDGVKKSNGLGDMTFIINYNLLSKRTRNKHGSIISQQLLVGGGVKLPTGKFAADSSDILATANNQVGTGSVDFILNAIYTYHINDWGINSSINYKINNSANNYQFGNRLSSSAFVFRSISGITTTFNPNVGLLYENLAPGKLNSLKIEDNGGYALLAAAGLEVNFSKMAVGFNAQLPVSQNLSNNQTTTKLRGMFHLTFAF